MKKITTILFLTVLIFNIFQFQLIYKAYQVILKKQAKTCLKNMSDEEMDVLVFTYNDLKDGIPFEIIHNDEILYKGEMYDIKKIEHESNQIVLLGFHDVNEKEWIQYWKSLIASDSTEADWQNTLFTQLQQFIWFGALKTIIPHNLNTNYTLYRYNHSIYENLFSRDFYHPPELYISIS